MNQINYAARTANHGATPANVGVPPPAPAQAADSGSSGAVVSSDSEWSDTDESPVASIVDPDDYETHESCEEVEESDEDVSAFLVDRSVAEQASRLVRDDPCEQKCLKRTEAELGNFLQSVSGMERSERITSVLTALYKADLKAASYTHAVLVMDFSQNLSCPSISDTPSMWYFLSLLSISVFGIYYANDAKQYNYVYDERVSGKGSDQVNSMRYDFLTKNVIARQIRRLTVYADNCGGQNKSNHVIHFLLALVHQGILDSVDFKFFVRRHTKNACDRGFGQIQNRIARLDCWTVDGVVKNVAAAASSSVVTRITLEDNILRDFKTGISELYKPLSTVQKYHIFSANKDNPGVITCKCSPNDDGISEDLRRKIDKVKTPSGKVSLMFERYLLPLTPPQPIAETIDQMPHKVRPFVPLEFQDDPLYAAPTADDAAQSNNTKRARLKRRADMALEAKHVQDEQQNSPSFVEHLEQAMNDIEDASALPKAKQPKRSTTKKKARKESST
ncbi:unnamed protein product [Phytophthora fragariaefolia]|uniref:Unnamed protein product n=1 Tax=Phytophthora fragariaefolia TaxID=1490495 RepID=A0A9W7D7P8_9STRA|nr:unnamed protein product [Phytophthora fragariaefolia]